MSKAVRLAAGDLDAAEAVLEEGALAKTVVHLDAGGGRRANAERWRWLRRQDRLPLWERKWTIPRFHASLYVRSSL